MFERKGGAFTALTWYIYCTGEPTQDKDGKIVFDPKIPHRQYRNPSMSPTKYAEQIHNITADKAYKFYSNEGWLKGRQLLHEYFTEEILNVGPRDVNLK